MRAAFASVAFAALAAAQSTTSAATSAATTGGAVASAVAPQQSAPAGCSYNYDGSFGLTPVNLTSTGTKSKRQASTHNPLGITLKDGILMDSQNRTGYVAANQQFQFDAPPQAGAIFTAGFSVCQNGSIALGSDVIWYRCLSGASTTSTSEFYNIYFMNELAPGQCIASHLQAVPLASGDGPAGAQGSVSAATFATASATNGTSTSSASMTSVTGASNATMTQTGSRGTGGATGGAGAGTVTSTSTATGGSGGSSGSSSASASASSASTSASTGGAPSTRANEMFGLAAGLLAFALL